MKNKLKEGWVPRWFTHIPKNRRRPMPSKPVEYTNYVRHQISKANRAVREGRTNGR